MVTVSLTFYCTLLSLKDIPYKLSKDVSFFYEISFRANGKFLILIIIDDLIKSNIKYALSTFNSRKRSYSIAIDN